MNLSNPKTRDALIALSPFAVSAIGFLTAHLAGQVMGVWAWIPVNLVLWSMFSLFIVIGGGRQAIRQWLQRPSKGWGWSALAILVGLIPLTIFLQNWQLFDSIWLVIAWLAFAIINPPLEEGYWRGLLLDKTTHWPGWLSIVYTSALFALNHPLTVGVNSIANRHPAVLVSTFVMGVVWALVYRKTGSLRWPIAAHVLVDLLNLSVLTFLNIYVPPAIPS